MCAHMQNDVLHVLRVAVFQFFTCLSRQVLGVLGVLCVVLGLCVLYALYVFLTCNTVGYKSAPPARDIHMVDKGMLHYAQLTARAHGQLPYCGL